MMRAIHSLLLLVAIAGAFLAGSVYNRRAAGKSSHDNRKPSYYVDPMHPAYKSRRPGIAPDCGMQLEPVYADDAAAPGPPAISPELQHLIGVRVSAVEKAPANGQLRLLGRVAPEETRVYRLIAGADGLISDISDVTTGSQVAADQWLATFSAPELRTPIQGFLVTLDVIDRQKRGGADAPAQARAAAESMQLAVDRLLNLGMSGRQVDEIRRTREVPAAIRILSPAAGFVLARNASRGQRFEKGAEWYRIADLSRVWVIADAFPQDARYIRPRQKARVVLPADGSAFDATVSQVLPQFDSNSRSLKVRLEMQNPEYALRPDMFVDVELAISLPAAISVPADAVLDSGRSKTVFVERAGGIFEPRAVETGWSFDHRVQIVHGLAPGERVAISGGFLLDSETRLRAAAKPAQR